MSNAKVFEPRLERSHEGEHHGDYSGAPVTITKAVKLFAFCAALNSCNLGYDLGVNSSAGELVQNSLGLSVFQLELFLGSINLWAMFGALGSQYFSDVYGRRRTFLVAAISFILGVTIQAAAPGYEVLMIGRIFVGLGVGVGLAIDPVYISEISPAKYRGYFVSWAEILLNVGLVFGFASGLVLSALSEGVRWRIMFLLGGILPFVMILLVTFVMPESPRWLVSKNFDTEAKFVLQSVYPEGFNVDPIIEDIKEALDRERMAEKSLGWGAICRPTPAFRRMIYVGVITAVIQQAVGINGIQYYLVFILQKSGIETATQVNLVLILLGLVKLAFIFVGARLFDTCGRRPLLFVSLIGMMVSLLVIAIIFFVQPDSSWVMVTFCLAIYLAFFSAGMGPGAWLIPSEIFSTSIRAKAMSLATFCNCAMGTVMASTFLSLEEILSWGGYFLSLCVVCFASFLFLFVFLPETKGRSLEDMSYYFAEITGDNSILEAERRLRSGQTPTVELSERVPSVPATGPDAELT